MNDHIRWNKQKHEQVLGKAVLEQQEQAKRKALLLMDRMFKAWKKKFCNGTKTKQEIVKSLYDLQGEIGKAADAEPTLKDWRKFTMNLIEDKITQVIATIQATENSIKEYVPTWAKDRMPHEAKFDSEEGFLNIPFIQAIQKKDGFVGFLREFPKVYALFDDGEIPVIGTVKTEVGLTKFLTLAMYLEKLMDESKPGDGAALAAKLLVGSTQPTPSADTDPAYPPAPAYDAGSDSAKSAAPCPDTLPHPAKPTPDTFTKKAARWFKRYGSGSKPSKAS